MRLQNGWINMPANEKNERSARPEKAERDRRPEKRSSRSSHAGTSRTNPASRPGAVTPRSSAARQSSKTAAQNARPAPVMQQASRMQPVKKKEKKSTDRKLYAPANGKLIPLSSVADPVLANKMLGEGIAVDITGSQIVSPCSGTVVMISNNSHAIGIESDLGDSVLVHIGMDTAAFKGRGFDVLVSDSQKVKPGQPLVRLDRKFFEQQNADLTTCVIVTSAERGDYLVLEGETAAAGRTPVMEKAAQ